MLLLISQVSFFPGSQEGIYTMNFDPPTAEESANDPAYEAVMIDNLSVFTEKVSQMEPVELEAIE